MSSASLPSILAALAAASCRRDSVLHFADANPDHAAMSATMASNAASMIVTMRSRPVGSLVHGVLAVLRDLLADLGRP